MERNDREVQIGNRAYHLRAKYPLRRVNAVGQALGVELFTQAFEKIDFLPVFKSPAIQLAVLKEILEEEVDDKTLDEMTGADFMQLFSIFFIEASLSTIMTSSGESYFPAMINRITQHQGLQPATSSSVPSSPQPVETRNGPNGSGITIPFDSSSGSAT